MLEPYRAAAIQFATNVITDPSLRDEVIAQNRDRATATIERILQTSTQPPRLFQFPVLFLQGAYNEARSPEARYQISFALPGPEIEPLIAFCHKHDIYLASSCVERHDKLPGWFFHSGFILGPEGLVLRYPKSQARSSAGVTIIKDRYDEYTAVFGRDAVHPVADTKIGRLAVSVEAEIFVPEISRAFAAKGVEVLLHPTVEHVHAHPWMYDQVKAARAYENRMYVVSANVGVAYTRDPKTGETRATTTRGGSAVFGPDGRLLAGINGPGEAIVSAPIDIAALRDARKERQVDTEFSPVLFQDVYRLS